MVIDTTLEALKTKTPDLYAYINEYLDYFCGEWSAEKRDDFAYDMTKDGVVFRASVENGIVMIIERGFAKTFDKVASKYFNSKSVYVEIEIDSRDIDFGFYYPDDARSRDDEYVIIESIPDDHKIVVGIETDY
ncbi:MAG: hypothetical protein QXV17_05000 [Candidatus Micrarchaeaceae archaeon]